jgi:hypothetical protein
MPSEEAGMGKASLPIRQLKTLPNAEIGERQDVRVAEIEDQQHLDGPLADAVDLGQPVDDFSRRHRPKRSSGGEPPVRGEAREVLRGTRLPAGQPGCPEPLGRRRQDLGRVQAAGAIDLGHAAENSGSGLARKLLAHDGPQQVLERGGAAGCGEPAVADAADQLGHHGVDQGEVGDRAGERGPVVAP